MRALLYLISISMLCFYGIQSTSCKKEKQDFTDFEYPKRFTFDSVSCLCIAIKIRTSDKTTGLIPEKAGSFYGFPDTVAYLTDKVRLRMPFQEIELINDTLAHIIGAPAFGATTDSLVRIRRIDKATVSEFRLARPKSSIFDNDAASFDSDTMCLYITNRYGQGELRLQAVAYKRAYLSWTNNFTMQYPPAEIAFVSESAIRLGAFGDDTIASVSLSYLYR